MVWKIVYNLLVFPFGWIIFLFLSFFRPKIRQGIKGRKKLFRNIERALAVKNITKRRLWFHSASLGEFEQAKPIISSIKKKYSDVSIIVTFFSPSGYLNAFNYPLADIVSYIPFDSIWNAKRFVNILKPNCAIFMRYDLWPNHIWALKDARIPIIIASATFNNKSIGKFFPVRSFYKSVYNTVDYILTVSEKDKRRFKELKISHPVIDVIGDTRFEQVLHRRQESLKREVLNQDLVQNRRVLVVGSSWEEDEAVLLPVFERIVKRFNDLLIILVPHEPTQATLERLENQLKERLSYIRFSELDNYLDERAILVDSVGMLMTLYKYATLAYVGGSFRQGVHNVLEPTVYGIPVIFGPRFENSQEAVKLVEIGGAFVGNDSDQIYNHICRLIENEQERLDAGFRAKDFIEKNVGATDIFISFLEKVS